MLVIPENMNLLEVLQRMYDTLTSFCHPTTFAIFDVFYFVRCCLQRAETTSTFWLSMYGDTFYPTIAYQICYKNPKILLISKKRNIIKEKNFLKILKINEYNWIEILDFFSKSVGSLKQKRQKGIHVLVVVLNDSFSR